MKNRSFPIRALVAPLAASIAIAIPAVAQDGASPAAPAAPATGKPSMISESQLSGLPLNGRSYSQLATLQAGVIGNVQEVHVWTNRPHWACGCPRPAEAPRPPMRSPRSRIPREAPRNSC